jgi:N-acetylmuramoyl-L-alanine amidase
MGWKSPGYHWIIDPQGNQIQLAQDKDITNGVKGYNSESIHISYIGGVDAENRPMDTRTNEQVMTMFKLVYNYKKLYPNAQILGHCDFPNVKKACPSFDVKTWLRATGLNK